MLPEDNIDDLFRRQLGGHETPPGDDLWARLQNSAPQPEAHDPRLDELFQKSLGTHATPPRRELWERLEDEHLRPRQRRAAAWWPVAMAAAVLILLLAGGAGLWLGFPFGKISGSEVAVKKDNGINTTTKPVTIAAAPRAPEVSTETALPAATPLSKEAVATDVASAAPESAVSAPIQKNTTAQATRSLALASTASKARKLAERQSPRHPLGSTRQPDAAAPSPSLVARTTAPLAPTPARNPAADEPHLNPAPAPVLAQASTPAPTAEIVPAGALITVDVRSGNVPAARGIRRALSDVASASAEPAERRGLGGRLLQQAGHLVRGERLSLAEATGLPENVTLRANIGGRTVSKSIQL